MRRLDVAIAATAVVLIGGIAATIVIAARQHQPIDSSDPGIAACRQLARGDQMPDQTWTAAGYRRARGQFAASADPDLRTHGVTLVDLAWRYGDGRSGPMPLETWHQLTAAVAGLAAACANHGVTLPHLIQESR